MELKTLKDIEIEVGEILGFLPKKTLRKLDKKVDDSIKQEAIKWIKEIIDAKELGAFIPEEQKFISFFNITEEDLKGGKNEN